MSKFLRRRLLIFIIKVFRTIVFIFIVISQRFGRYVLRPSSRRTVLRPSRRYVLRPSSLSNSETFTELRTTSFIETTGVACSDSISHNWVQVLSTRLWLTESEQMTPVVSIKDVARSSVKVPEFDKHLKKAGGHIGWNVVEITIKMKTIVRKTLMLKMEIILKNKAFFPGSNMSDYNANVTLSPVDCGCRIHRLHSFRWVRPPPTQQVSWIWH